MLGISQKNDAGGIASQMKFMLMASVAGAGLMPGAAAQDEAAADDSDMWALEEIVVTARHRKESLQNLSVSISAVTGETLERSGVGNARDIEHMVPNLVFGNTGTDGETFVGMRGVGDFSRNIGFDTRVGVYLDGVYVGQSLAINQAMADVQHVEVLRGPQGTLFGKNTSSGVINVVSRDPGYEFEGSIKAETGNFGMYQGTAILNVPISDGKAAARIVLTGKHRDGYVKNLYNDKDLLSEDYYGGRVKLLVEPSEKLTLKFSGDFNASRPNILFLEPSAPNGFGGYVGAPEVREVTQDVDLKDELDGYGMSMQADYQFDSGMVLTSITGYRHAERLTVSDEDASPLDFIDADHFEDSFNHFSQELRLASAPHEKFDYVLGAYYFHQASDSLRSVASGTDFLGEMNIASTTTDVNTDVFALFANGNIYLNEDWSINAGLRWNSEKKDVVFDQNATALFPAVGVIDDRKDDDINYTISLNWQATNDVKLYATHAHGTKGGGWNVDFVASDDIAFEGEKVDTFEFGMKSELAGGRVRLNAAAFVSKFDSLQVFQFVFDEGSGTTNLSLTNAGKATAKGFEFDLQAMPAEGLEIFASVGYADTTFDEFKNGGGLDVHYDGNRLPRAPKWTTSVAAQYTGQINEDLDWIIRAEHTYRSAQYFNPSNDATTLGDGYGLLNARIGVVSNSGGWEIFAWGKNLTNELYEMNRGVSFLGIPFDLYGAPRTYGVSLGYRF
ncbi:MULTISPECIES: TonB-dependent receptor [Kordiimonas]|uniref:TonB-dependent receptor n=1 Tax=Kordiimonas TaxID=288021 RepID=UPI00257AC0DE|nr:TonB-dependent receptor [Kordiimonas sp. UBA4487]